ncbi:MAG: hypothetical protein RJB38_777 [Pseudomonadota bacterium]|jgi:hypothetical protein
MGTYCLNFSDSTADEVDVKVAGIRDFFAFRPSVKTNTESGDGHGGAGHDEASRQSRQSHDAPAGQAPEPDLQLTSDEQVQAIEKAISEFQIEAASQNHGLSAAVGPGLRVVLSDVNGTVIRQFEPAEFLRLRKSGAKDSRGRGKLLDQKL